MYEYKRFIPQSINVKITAIIIFPVPVAIPAAIARKMLHISFAVPGTDRNLIKLNAPITATPVPRFPLTSIITIWTIAGSKARVITKLFETLLLCLNTQAMIKPSANEAAVHIKKSVIVIEELFTSENKLSTIIHLIFL